MHSTFTIRRVTGEFPSESGFPALLPPLTSHSPFCVDNDEEDEDDDDDDDDEEEEEEEGYN